MVASRKKPNSIEMLQRFQCPNRNLSPIIFISVPGAREHYLKKSGNLRPPVTNATAVKKIYARLYGLYGAVMKWNPPKCLRPLLSTEQKRDNSKENYSCHVSRTMQDVQGSRKTSHFAITPFGILIFSRKKCVFN